MKKTLSSALVVALLMPLSATAQAPRAVPIGAAGAVSGRVRVTPPQSNAVGRVIESGQPLYLNESVTTDAEGRLQILLLDETVFTIGPNSSMVLDTFVYDPSTGAGKVAARIIKGAFRFVTGKIARKDPSEMTVRLPVGVIGVRGTMVAGEVNGKTATVALLGPGAGNNAGERIGQLKVFGGDGKAVTLLRPGWASTIGGDGHAGAPFKLPAVQLNSFLNIGSATGGAGSGKTKLGEFDITHKSGQDTAVGLDTKAGVLGANGAFQNAELLLTQIPQSFNGPATWDQVRAIGGNQTGTFTGTGSFTATSGSFTPMNAQTTVTLTLAIDFGNRTIGGGSSALTVAPVSFFTGANTSIGVGVNGNPIPLSSLSGAAVLTPAQATSMGSAWNGTTITLMNNNGVTAAKAVANVQYNQSGNAGFGTVTGTR